MTTTPSKPAPGRRLLFSGLVGAGAAGIADSVGPLTDLAVAAPRRAGGKTCHCTATRCSCKCKAKTRSKCRCKTCHGPEARGRCRCHSVAGSGQQAHQSASQPTTQPAGPVASTPVPSTDQTLGAGTDPGSGPGTDPGTEPGNNTGAGTGPGTDPLTELTGSLIDDDAARVLVSRFSYGITPRLAGQVAALGGANLWFESQLAPQTIPDPGADELASWWPSLANSPSTLWSRHIAGTEYGRDVMASYQRWLLVRRVRTERQVHEVMTEFWENHFNVPVRADQIFTHRVGYGATIRANALGRFEDLLKASVLHPAMLIYLGAGVSTAVRPNENLGRELLELHTVGRGNYGEDDVKSSARILTGWHVDTKSGSWASSYQSSDHWVGPVQVMSFSDPNASPDGRDVTMRYLSYLANHPSTAARIARKLCVKFVGDEPSSALVDLLAAAYLASGTSILAMLRVLVTSPEFGASGGAKVRDPGEDVVASFRALDVSISRPPAGASVDYAAIGILWASNAIGAEPHDWPQPDGAPATNAAWASPSRFAGSMRVHVPLASGLSPKSGVGYHSPTEWFGAGSRTLADLIDGLAQQILVQRPAPELVTACCQAVDFPPSTVITASHRVVRWNFGRLITTILDSPQHMTR